MAYNKFSLKDGTAMLSLVDDTISQQDVRLGKIFHGRDGKEYIGTLEDGIEIDRTEINSEGDLIIAYSNGTTKDLGKVKGERGL